MPYKCRTCNKYFSTSSNRLRHEKSMHNGEESDGQDDSDEEESIDYEVEGDGDGDSDGGGAEDDDEAEDFEWAKWNDFVDQSIKDLDEPINTADDLLEDATFSQFCEDLKVKPAMKHKKRRFRPGTVTLREIKHYQKSTNLLISKRAFQGLVREIGAHFNQEIGFNAGALQTLQEAAEAHLIALFHHSNLCALSSKKQTILPKHMCLSRKIAGKNVVVPL